MADDKSDKVNHPIHYGGKDNPYEVIKVLEHWLTREEFIGGLKFNIQKYYARAKQKGGDEDHFKGAWYAAYLADFLKRCPADAAPQIARVDAAFAKNLRESMELNARMKNRIGKLHRLLSGLIGESPIAASEIETALNRLIKGNLAIEAILKDEEPTWPGQ
jgi:hypothetical protein